MIDLVMTGKCKDCPVADLEIEDQETYLGSSWTVKCIHEDACDRVEQMKEDNHDG